MSFFDIKPSNLYHCNALCRQQDSITLDLCFPHCTNCRFVCCAPFLRDFVQMHNAKNAVLQRERRDLKWRRAMFFFFFSFFFIHILIKFPILVPPSTASKANFDLFHFTLLCFACRPELLVFPSASILWPYNGCIMACGEYDLQFT